MNWRCRANCRDEDPELFFPISHGGPGRAQVDAAKAICARCPVRAECLTFALRTDSVGIVGGTTEDERRAMTRPVDPPAGPRRRPQLTPGQRRAISRARELGGRVPSAEVSGSTTQVLVRMRLAERHCDARRRTTRLTAAGVELADYLATDSPPEEIAR
jgi:WhiB family redox-sensing transcriptional regulator